jgi:hypothetical protein
MTSREFVSGIVKTFFAVGGYGTIRLADGTEQQFRLTHGGHQSPDGQRIIGRGSAKAPREGDAVLCHFIKEEPGGKKYDGWCHAAASQKTLRDLFKGASSNDPPKATRTYAPLPGEIRPQPSALRRWSNAQQPA